jgi:putative oxidoreductase
MEIARSSEVFSEGIERSRWTRVLLGTDDSTVLLVARLTLGIVMLPHGAQKLLGWFGGYGFAGTMEFFTETMGIPWVVALLVVLLESLGAVALIAGAVGRLFAVGIAAIMLGAISTTHFPHGFFMNWFGNQQGEGFEYHLLALGLAAVVTIAGSGRWSVDRWLVREDTP